MHLGAKGVHWGATPLTKPRLAGRKSPEGQIPAGNQAPVPGGSEVARGTDQAPSHVGVFVSPSTSR